MQGQNQTNPYLEKNLDTFRSAVKIFSRHSLILIPIAIASIFLSLKYIDLVSEQQEFENEKQVVAQEQKELASAQNIAKQISRGINAERQAIIKNAKSSAVQLANNWQQFLKEVKTASKKTPGDALISEPNSPSETGNNESELNKGQSPLQSRTESSDYLQNDSDSSDTPIVRARTESIESTPTRPNVPTKSDPSAPVVSSSPEYSGKEALRNTYNLDNKQIETITKKGAIKDNDFLTAEAYKIGKQVFLGEINRTYKQLNSNIKDRYSALRQRTQDQLDKLNLLIADTAIQAPPSAQKLILQPPRIPVPEDMNRFRTVSEKERTLEGAARKNTLNLEAAQSPLNKIENQLNDLQESTQQYQNKIDSQIVKNNGKIDELIKDIGTVQQQITGLDEYFDFLTLETDTFVRISPYIAAVVFLLLASRLSKLYRLRRRLYDDCISTGMKPEDINLTLSVQDSLLEWLGGLGPGPFGIVSIIHLALPAVITVMLANAVQKIYACPVEEITDQIWPGYYKLVYVIIFFTCASVYLPLLKKLKPKKS